MKFLRRCFAVAAACLVVQQLGLLLLGDPGFIAQTSETGLVLQNVSSDTSPLFIKGHETFRREEEEEESKNATVPAAMPNATEHATVPSAAMPNATEPKPKPTTTETITIDAGSCTYNAVPNFRGPFLCTRSSSSTATFNTDDDDDDPLPENLLVVFDNATQHSDGNPDARIYFAHDLSATDDQKDAKCRNFGPLPNQSDAINILYTEESTQYDTFMHESDQMALFSIFIGYDPRPMTAFVFSNFGFGILVSRLGFAVVNRTHEWIHMGSMYKFWYAAENYLCDGYVTEKFWIPYAYGSVPILYGTGVHAMYAPSDDSYLDVRNFTSAAELGRFLLRLDQYDELYMRYHAWRTRPESELNPKFVELLNQSTPIWAI